MLYLYALLSDGSLRKYFGQTPEQIDTALATSGIIAAFITEEEYNNRLSVMENERRAQLPS